MRGKNVTVPQGLFFFERDPLASQPHLRGHTECGRLSPFCTVFWRQKARVRREGGGGAG